MHALDVVASVKPVPFARCRRTWKALESLICSVRGAGSAAIPIPMRPSEASIARKPQVGGLARNMEMISRRCPSTLWRRRRQSSMGEADGASSAGVIRDGGSFDGIARDDAT